MWHVARMALSKDGQVREGKHTGDVLVQFHRDPRLCEMVEI